MKKKWLVIGIVIAIVLIMAISLFGSYNQLVQQQEAVKSAFSTIDVQLQRRSDLIPNLVNTVKGYSIHEQEILTNIADARAKLSGAGTTQERLEGESELSSALNRLLVVVENYPELKADANFQQLADELSGTENRISVARKDYNDAVTAYNTSIRTYPTKLLAGIFGFDAEPYFEAADGAQQVPTVDFE